MNILFFSRLFYPHIGGVEKHVLEISRLLIGRGHKVTIVTGQYSSDLKSRDSVDGIKVFRMPNFIDNKFKKIKIWKWLWQNKNLIENSDIVHCHDVFFWYFPFRFLYFKKPVYTTFHGYEGYPLKSKDVLAHKISEILSMGNICVGNFMEKWYGTKSTHITYGAVNIKKSNSQMAINEKSAVFVGRLDEQTGIKMYADAVKLIRKKIPNFEFEIIGDGPFRKEVEKDFTVLGFKTTPEKYLLKYNFAFVSRYLSILEAMSAKKMVFAVYDNPLKEDYLRMAPFSKNIIICNSASELASKALFYLNNSNEKEKIVRNAYDWVINRTWKEIVSIYLKLWKV